MRSILRWIRSTSAASPRNPHCNGIAVQWRVLHRASEEVSVTGATAIDPFRFGIAPFSVLGAAIAVQDRVNITFRIRARRMQ